MRRAAVLIGGVLSACGGDDGMPAVDPCALATEVPYGLGRSVIAVDDGYGAIGNADSGTSYVHINSDTGEATTTEIAHLSTAPAPSQLAFDGEHVATVALDSPRMLFFASDGSDMSEGASLGLDPGLATGGPPTLMVITKIATGFAIAHVSPQTSGWRTNYVETTAAGAPTAAPVGPPGNLAAPRMMSSLRGHAAFAYRYEGTPGQTVVSLTMDPWPMGLSYLTESADGAAGITTAPDDSTVLVVFNDTLYSWNGTNIMPVNVTGRPVAITPTPRGYAVAVILDGTLRVVSLDALFAFLSVTDVATEAAFERVAMAADGDRVVITYATTESPTAPTKIAQVCPD